MKLSILTIIQQMQNQVCQNKFDQKQLMQIRILSFIYYAKERQNIQKQKKIFSFKKKKQKRLLNTFIRFYQTKLR
ncbi:unnamed protein product [Paramecium sonneborni]|uniref:Uncharacterized protein n=1 Tax=Paramecium sonneborni TaxID=65129 RepID=A0A8S1PKF3_9CILI|nr:unnamed protein product [Paramecium sonneborni]